VLAISVTWADKTGICVRDVFSERELLAETPRQQEHLVRPAVCIGTQ
jgi:hypothetical protein